ncbi:MAG: hypothetical protein WD534_12910 [Phycisphaeraceae bacterium]
MADGDTLKKVQTGQPLKIPAQAYNAFIDTARAHAQREQDRQRLIRGHHPSADVVLVRNDSGDDRDRFAVLGLDEPIVAPEDNLDQFKSRVAFIGVEPTEDHRGRFALLLEPLKAGRIGHALLSGVGVARIEVADEQHGFADIAREDDPEADLYVLHSTSGGSGHGGEAQILWKEDGTGLKWAVLRLGASATASLPARITAVAHVAIDHADYGKMAWQEVRWDPQAGAWVDVPNGRSGAIAEPTHAREINGRPMVAPGTIVPLSATAGTSGGGYWFSMDSAPTYEDLGDLADAQYQTTDFDAEASGNAWFDRDHVHHGGPTSRYDPQGELVPMPGAHIEGWARAWFARFVSRLTGGEDPSDESYEQQHHDITLGVERRVIHGDPAGHFQWVGPVGQSEVEAGPPEIVLRHKDPGPAEHTLSFTDGTATLGTVDFDKVGHYTGGDQTIQIEGVKGDKGDKGDPGEDGADGPTYTGESPWIDVDNGNHVIRHTGPGDSADLQDFVAGVTLNGQNASATGATLATATGKLSKDGRGHLRETQAVGEADDQVHIPQVLSDLADVGGSPSEGDVLVFTGGQWTPVTPVVQAVVTDVALAGGELTQTKRELRVLPAVGAAQDSKIADVENC